MLNAFVDRTAGTLPRAEALVWLVLYRDTRDGTARTSHADLARRAGVSRRSVVRAVAGLLRQKLLVRTYRGGLNRGVSAYRVRPVGAADDG
ncbi:MAG: transcriptional regulator [Phycisphaerales bacterium]|nr:transcriptional regulator [Phycisphaerales bacterium]